MTIKEFKHSFDRYLADECYRRADSFRQTIKDDELSGYVDHAVAITLNGGKRIRPYLVDLMYRTATTSASTKLIDLEVAIELFQMFCLIHDDIMDKGTKRHSIPTVNTLVTNAKGEHIGNSHAILIGDLFASWVTDLIFTVQNHDVWSVFQNMYVQVIAGQMLDVDSTVRTTVSHDYIDHKTFLKTASYSVIGPMKLGRALATPSTDLDIFIETFGTYVGMGFQLQDDLFDWLGGAPDTSKNSMSDITRKQHTSIRNWIVEHGTKKHLTTLHELENMAIIDNQKAYELAKSSGALQATSMEVGRNFGQAQETLDAQHFDPTIKLEWQNLLDLIKNRTH